MTAICFVCNLPILSHQVGLVWQGGNGWDDLVREQVEESTLRQRLGSGRRDSAAQIGAILDGSTAGSPPHRRLSRDASSPPPATSLLRQQQRSRRRRRSSLAQLTDLLREWGGGVGVSAFGKESSSSSSGVVVGRRGSKDLPRRETLADIAKSLPWGRSSSSAETSSSRKRRESSAEAASTKSSGIKSRRESGTDFRSDLARLWSHRRESSSSSSQRRGSGESARSGRRESITPTPPTSSRRGRRDSTRIVLVTAPSAPQLHLP
ncbi:micronuclear linker histone polyprotein-like [Hetaerina americana]|uniref:micronuclear linker histone polyprotein-like n=1 Tax=Hetaerina americana TaxID=62018 RepID=UPI003A7F57FD